MRLSAGSAASVLDHFLKGAVAALGREIEIGATGLRFFRIGGEGAADEFDLLVDCRRDAMNAADEGATSAADHAITNFPAHKNVRGSQF
jgi:hypothetical protein